MKGSLNLGKAQRKFTLVCGWGSGMVLAHSTRTLCDLKNTTVSHFLGVKGGTTSESSVFS